jgi:outer membrane receptor for ferrienterochelin and colicins
MHIKIFRIVLLVLTSIGAAPVIAQTLQGKIVEWDESMKMDMPLAGANIFWLNTTQGVNSDASGNFSIPYDGKNAKLIISFVGFQNDTVTVKDASFLKVSLKKSVELKEVNVEAKQSTTTISTLNPLNVEKLNEGEILKAACCNLSEAFETNPTINVSYKDAVTGAKEIQLLGLSGIYSQLLTENIPNMRGIAGIYGLTFIPGPWMESIQITKGSGSVANGFESTTGQINIEFKKPEEKNTPRFYLNLFAEENSNVELNTFYKKKFNNKWSSILMAHGSYMQKNIDNNDDGFRDIPFSKQLNLYNRWNYHSGKKLESQFGIKFIHDERNGGQIRTVNETDPNKNYIADITNTRAEVFGKLGIVFPEKPYQSIGNIVSVTYHDLNSNIGLKTYDATEKTIYYQSIYQSILGNTNHQYKVGIGYQFDLLEDEFNRLPSVNEQHVPGAFVEYTYSLMEKFKLVAGLRADYHNEYNWIVTPRLHGKYNFTDNLVLRWSGGKSFRVPYSIADNISVLASSKEIRFDEKAKPEEAWNYGLNLTQRYTVAGNEGTLSLDFYRTDFINQLIVDQYTEKSVVHFYNLDGKSNATSFQIMLNQEFWEHLNVRLAYKKDDVEATYNGVEEEKPLVARERALMNLGYETENHHWRFDYTFVWEGKKRLVNTFEDVGYGSLPDYSPDFFVMNAQVTKEFKRFEIYGGAENILDFVQEHPIINPEQPFSNEFDATQVWGPIDGRRIYLGLRFSIK